MGHWQWQFRCVIFFILISDMINKNQLKLKKQRTQQADKRKFAFFRFFSLFRCSYPQNLRLLSIFLCMYLLYFLCYAWHNNVDVFQGFSRTTIQALHERDEQREVQLFRFTYILAFYKSFEWAEDTTARDRVFLRKNFDVLVSCACKWKNERK